MKVKKKDSGIKLIVWLVVALVAIVLSVILCMNRFMININDKAIEKVSGIYMSELSEQIKEKCISILSIRMDQLEGLNKRTLSNSGKSREELLLELKTNAEVRGFSYLSLVSDDGNVETVYGEEITFKDKDGDMGKLADSGSVISRGYDSSGQRMLVLGISAGYEMSNGENSFALIVALPMKELREDLFLNNNQSGIHFYIIDGEGELVVRDDYINENYFDYLCLELEQAGVKETEQYVEQLKKKVSQNEDFMEYIEELGAGSYVQCLAIEENTDWNILAVMQNTVISETVVEMNNSRMTSALVSIMIIILSMMCVFAIYYRMMKQKIKALDIAKNEAFMANKAKSEFLSSMSHDIRTPMNAVVGMTELAIKNVNNPERTIEYLKKIKTSSKHLMGLINDVLDMSKIESGKIQISENPMSLRDTMEDIVNIMQPQTKVKKQHFDIFIENIISENVISDSVRLNQVLLNLVSNAMKYTPEDGTIGVYAYQKPSPKGEDYVQTHFKVCDNGIGMSEDFQKKIYDTFTREENEYVQSNTGTGLGMSITKAIVDLMGGTIELKSEVNKGSEFHITLDIRKSNVDKDHMKLPAWNVLVIDDNEQLCVSAASNLEELGVNTEWTTDGMHGVEMIEEHNKRNADYDFVLIDWRMPNMDGIETIHKIRERVGEKLPVFLISAYDLGDVKNELDSLLVEGFIPKPLFKSTLYERLSRYVDGNNTVQKPVEEEQQEEDFTGKRVLLAEDIDINWEIVYEMLSVTGLELERAVNGKDCVEKFESSEIGYYDMIFMDIRMPVMNGYEATKTIRALNRQDKNLPIIAMTADAFQDDIQNCVACGMNKHIAKPIELKKCIDILNEFLK